MKLLDWHSAVGPNICSTALCQRPAAPRKLRTFQKEGRSEGKRAAQRRASRAAPLDFWAKTRQKRRSATSCVDPARFRHLRIRSQKVTNIFSWCPILGNLRDYFFMHLENLWFHTFSENVHALAPSKSNSAHRDCPKNEVLATKVLALARSGFVSTFVLRLGTSMYSLVWACI